jgi:hypothetical protein
MDDDSVICGVVPFVSTVIVLERAVAVLDHVFERAAVSVPVCVGLESDAVPADRDSVTLGDTVCETVTLRCPDSEAVRVGESTGDAVLLRWWDPDAVAVGESARDAVGVQASQTRIALPLEFELKTTDAGCCGSHTAAVTLVNNGL